MIALAAGAIVIGYTLLYGAVANGGTLALAPWLSWQHDASAYNIPRGEPGSPGSAGTQPSSKGPGG
jgi:hypothetical protein